jgi:NAD(P)H dehydrogenase (quinone)
MNFLVIYAHPNPGSFSHAILEKTVEELTSQNHIVNVRDLYALNFDPVLKPADFTRSKSGNVPEDIRIEQEFITKADVFILVYPVWWGGMPAILKGYIDRTFLHGFAFVYNETEKKGLFAGKKALILNTHGTPKEEYDANGMTDAMATISQKGIFDFCGVETLDHLFFGNITMTEDGSWHEHLDELALLLKDFSL